MHCNVELNLFIGEFIIELSFSHPLVFVRVQWRAFTNFWWFQLYILMLGVTACKSHSFTQSIKVQRISCYKFESPEIIQLNGQWNMHWNENNSKNAWANESNSIADIHNDWAFGQWPIRLHANSWFQHEFSINFLEYFLFGLTLSMYLNSHSVQLLWSQKQDSCRVYSMKYFLFFFMKLHSFYGNKSAFNEICRIANWIYWIGIYVWTKLNLIKGKTWESTRVSLYLSITNFYHLLIVIYVVLLLFSNGFFSLSERTPNVPLAPTTVA